MNVTKIYLTMASVILFTVSFFYYLYEYHLYGQRITSGKNNYYQARTTTTTEMAKKITIDEIIKNADLMDKKQCQTYKNDIKNYCLNQYNRHIKNYYDLSIDAEDMDTYQISKQICCTLKQAYIQCNFAYLNIICEPEQMASIFEPIKTQIDICSKYFDVGDKCYLIANYIREDSTESDDEDDDDDTD